MTTKRKSDLAEHISQHHGISHAEAMRILTTVRGYIADKLANGSTIKIQGLGEFMLVTAKPRLIRPFGEGEAEMTNPKPRVRFIAANTLNRDIQPNPFKK